MMDQYEEYDTEERLASAERALHDEIEQRDKNEWRNHDQVGELRQQLAAQATEIEKWRDIEAPRLEAELKSLKALRGQEIKSYEAWIKRLQDEIERLKSHSCEHNDARIETLREAAKRGCEGCRTRGWTEALGTDSPIGWHHLTVGGQGGPHTMKCKVPFIHDMLAELRGGWMRGC